MSVVPRLDGPRSDLRPDEESHDEPQGDSRDDARDDSDDRVFRALASPSRRRVLSLVRDRARPVSDLAEQLGVSQPAASQHLAVLREAGLVTVEARGRRRLYRADVERIAALRSFFDEYWDAALDGLARAAEGVAAERKVPG